MEGLPAAAKMKDFVDKGGPLMWVILAASVVAVAVFAERLTYLRRVSVSVEDLLRGLANLIRHGKYAEAQIISRGTPGPVARVVVAALMRHDLPRADLKGIVQEAGQLEVPHLEKNLRLLATVAQITPLVGLLGTVSGMISAFVTVSSQGGYVTANTLSNGVYQSLLTTAGGLVVAIPAFAAYSYLSARVNMLLHDMERAGIEIVNLLVDNRGGAGAIIPFGSPAPADAPLAADFRQKKLARE